jgi:acetylornithine deacetylase/succinyl-diaminopimelate desuccinylase-like protein
MGTIVPKASINAIRSGYPYNLTSAPQVAAFYIDTRILPGANPMDVRDELRGVLKKVAIEGTVELFVYRPGFEAKGAENLIETIKRCHAQTFSTPPAIVGDPVTSMWRDTNAFNELGIPAISYAPRAQSHATTKSFKVKDLTDAALIYARIGMELCMQTREPVVPLGAHPDREIAASVGKRNQPDS